MCTLSRLLLTLPFSSSDKAVQLHESQRPVSPVQSSDGQHELRPVAGGGLALAAPRGRRRRRRRADHGGALQRGGGAEGGDQDRHQAIELPTELNEVIHWRFSYVSVSRLSMINFVGQVMISRNSVDSSAPGPSPPRASSPCTRRRAASGSG